MLFVLEEFTIRDREALDGVPDRKIERSFRELLPWLPVPVDPNKLRDELYEQILVVAGVQKLAYPTPPVPTQKKRKDTPVIVECCSNPFRPYSAVHRRWEVAKPQTGDTIRALQDRGLDGGDVNWCVKRGFLTLNEDCAH